MVQVEERLGDPFCLKEQTFLAQVMLQKLRACEAGVVLKVKKHFNVSFWDVLHSVRRDVLPSSPLRENTRTFEFHSNKQKNVNHF